MKNLLRKISIALSVVAVSGIMLSPVFALAKENDNHGRDVARVAISISKFGDDKLKLENIGSLLGNNSAIKDAQKVFKQAVKNANAAFKTARKAAHDKLNDALKAAANQTARISAVKTFLTDIMAAIKQRAAAKELALQNFIDALSGINTNQAPTANAQSVTLAKNTLKAITLTGSDVEGSALTFFALTSPTHGVLSGTVPNLTYLPATDFTGTDSFTFKVNDSSQDSAVATVSITVTP